MAKAEKRFVFTRNKYSYIGTSTSETDPMTLQEAVKYFAYTLSAGASYAHEKGNKKINCEPKTIKSLISNLNNVVNNSAANGYAGITYSAAEYTEKKEECLS